MKVAVAFIPASTRHNDQFRRRNPLWIRVWRVKDVGVKTPVSTRSRPHEVIEPRYMATDTIGISGVYAGTGSIED